MRDREGDKERVRGRRKAKNTRGGGKRNRQSERERKGEMTSIRRGGGRGRDRAGGGIKQQCAGRDREAKKET